MLKILQCCSVLPISGYLSWQNTFLFVFKRGGTDQGLESCHIFFPSLVHGLRAFLSTQTRDK